MLRNDDVIIDGINIAAAINIITAAANISDTIKSVVCFIYLKYKCEVVNPKT